MFYSNDIRPERSFEKLGAAIGDAIDAALEDNITVPKTRYISIKATYDGVRMPGYTIREPVVHIHATVIVNEGGHITVVNA